MTIQHTRRTILGLLAAAAVTLFSLPAEADSEQWLVLQGGEGPGSGKHIVLIAGDDEYRSEELIPQLAKILAVHHGFKCTVLFALNKKTGDIDPGAKDNIPGLHLLKTADLMIMFTRFRQLPDEQMKHIIDYTNSGKPIIGLRTSTHAFNYRDKSSPYAKYSFRSKDPSGGWGRLVLGETWIAHYGRHNRESTRGTIADGMQDHPIVRGCEDIWGPSDVYAISQLPEDARPVIMGHVLTGMKPSDPPKKGKKPVPIAWIRNYRTPSGKTARVFATTMGHGGDLQSEGFRRLLVNAAYWCLGLEQKLPKRAKVDLIGEYKPNPIGVGKHKRGLKPSDHALPQ